MKCENCPKYKEHLDWVEKLYDISSELAMEMSEFKDRCQEECKICD